jgi:hypothetical protein
MIVLCFGVLLGNKLPREKLLKIILDEHAFHDLASALSILGNAHNHNNKNDVIKCLLNTI